MWTCFDEVGDVDLTLLQRRFDHVAEAVAADHAEERDLRPERRGIGREDGGGTAECQGHLLGEDLLADFGKAPDPVEEKVHVQLAERQDVELFHKRALRLTRLKAT